MPVDDDDAESMPSRGRERVEHLLISAAADLLGEVGPKAVSVRMIAQRAGVNHGFVHHYFGGKSQLLKAAMTHLVEEHQAFAKDQAGGDVLPAPLALVQDQRYLRAVVRAVLDGDTDLAATEIAAGASIPRGALDHLTAQRGLSEADARTKALVAMGMAMERGWAALEPFIMAVLDVCDEEIDDVRDIVRRQRRRAYEALG
ncbi:MAG: TetR/AcrR family transcriptional regulator [Actinomycetota bacterium]